MRMNEGHYILDENDNPVEVQDWEVWAKWMETGNRRVDFTEIDKIHVSTVFLALDHSFSHGAPLLYETMIFGGKHDSWQNRYSTKEEALIGHQYAIDLVNGKVNE